MPSSRTLMLAGLRSRWTMLCSVCRFQRLRDLPRDRDGLVHGKAARMLLRRGGPRTIAPVGNQFVESSALHQLHDERTHAFSFFDPVNCAMFGWLRAASACASRANRSSRFLSPEKASGSTLSATSRFSRGSRPR